MVTGQFDPIEPARGVAFDRQLLPRRRGRQPHHAGCRRRVLPEGMSQERFDWLAAVGERARTDIIRTPGTESNVKEIYDACHELTRIPRHVIFNQFSEFGNHIGHYARCHRPVPRARLRVSLLAATTGPALALPSSRPPARPGHRRRRLPQGAPRHAHRAVEAAGVPHPAAQRLRRAQHPGHRRQARAADPQRHEYRLRGRRHLRQGHRQPAGALQHRRRPRLPARAHGRARGHHRGAGSLRLLVDLQRARRHQDTPSSRASAPTTCS